MRAVRGVIGSALEGSPGYSESPANVNVARGRNRGVSNCH